MCSSAAEINELLAVALPADDIAHAGGFRGDQALKPGLIEKQHFEQLRLVDRHCYLEKRFVREHSSSFGDGTDVTREFEIRQVLDEVLREPFPLKIGELTVPERKVLKVGDSLFEASGDERTRGSQVTTGKTPRTLPMGCVRCPGILGASSVRTDR